MKRFFGTSIALALLVAAAGVVAEELHRPNPRLWVEPRDIAERDLFYGAGSAARAPQGPFTFIEEDLSGSTPKFAVRDPAGVRWKVKLGSEARPETAASRIVWAIGYFVDEDYFLPRIQVTGIPSHLHRGRHQIGAHGTIDNVRLKREANGHERIGSWQWRNNPFSGTRELNGLLTLMAVINNWDLKDVNTAIRRSPNEADGSSNGDQLYMVSDLGATFGSGRLERTRGESEGNFEAYQHSRFIRKTTAEQVWFETPRTAAPIVIANTPEFMRRLKLRALGHHIPREDARWMGTLLARLSVEQLHDAFRAAGYTRDEADGFVAVLQARVAELQQL